MRRRGPILAAAGRRLGIGRRRIMAPFKPVVVDQAREEVVAKISVEARIVLVRIDDAYARSRRLGGQGGICRICTIQQAHR